MNQSIEQIEKDAQLHLEKAKDVAEVQDIRVRYLGRKGLITQALKGISQLPRAERPAAGKKANQIRMAVDNAIQTALKRIESLAVMEGSLDVSLPDPARSDHEDQQ